MDFSCIFEQFRVFDQLGFECLEGVGLRGGGAPGDFRLAGEGSVVVRHYCLLVDHVHID